MNKDEARQKVLDALAALGPHFAGVHIVACYGDGPWGELISEGHGNRFVRLGMVQEVLNEHTSYLIGREISERQ